MTDYIEAVLTFKVCVSDKISGIWLEYFLSELLPELVLWSVDLFKARQTRAFLISATSISAVQKQLLIAILLLIYILLVVISIVIIANVKVTPFQKRVQ